MSRLGYTGVVRKQIFLVALSALLTFLSFPPFSFGTYLGWIALAPLLFVLLREDRPRRGFFWGLLFGVLTVGGVLSWIWWFYPLDWLGFGKVASLAIVGAGYLVTVVYLAFFFGAFGWLVVLLKNRSWTDYLTVPAALIVSDFFRSLGPLAFPPALGDTLVSNLPALQLAAVTGKWGLTALVAVTSLLGARLLTQTRYSNVLKNLRIGREAVVVGALLAGVLGWGWWRINNLPSGDGEVRVAIFQGNNERYFAENEAAKKAEVAVYETMLKDNTEPFDLAVLPESAVLLDLRSDAEQRNRLTSNLSEDQSLLLGLPLHDVEPTGRLRTNSALVFDAKGMVLSRYDKQHLIPLREYGPDALVTVSAIFGADQLVETLSTEAVPGPNKGPIDTGHGKSAVLICFESLFPTLARRQVSQGAEWIAIITNDAWFKRSQAAAQHNALAALRAVETRRWVVRAANTGISSVFGPTGREVIRTNLFERDVLSATIEKRSEETPYARFGDWLVVVSGAIVGGRLLSRYLRKD